MAATEQLARTPTPAPHHCLPVPDVVVLLGTDRERGLSEHEAAGRLARLGRNVLPRLHQRGPWVRLLLQFHHPLIYVLLAAAGATLLLGDLVDAGVILAVVLANAVIGFVQESRAEQALDALMDMVRTETTVVRDGARRRVRRRSWCPATSSCWTPGTGCPRTSGWSRSTSCTWTSRR
ncbi:hypothetical protein A7K94_0216905 [Modestobacter sp. VKM Ac-2676]|nr:hypothetical protein A7K94_0216905 [Modestobacter sp. VKM Ac-2676]